MRLSELVKIWTKLPKVCENLGIPEKHLETAYVSDDFARIGGELDDQQCYCVNVGDHNVETTNLYFAKGSLELVRVHMFTAIDMFTVKRGLSTDSREFPNLLQRAREGLV